MTRLESAARDYAIAALSRPGDAEDALYSACSTSDIVVHGVTEEWRDWVPDGSEEGGVDVWLVPPRLLRARVALLLRLLRRVEACEQGCSWARFGVLVGLTDRMVIQTSFGAHTNAWSVLSHFGEMMPWRPLWLDAPPHTPGITPAQRRSTRRPEDT